MCLASCKYCQLHNPKFWRLNEEMGINDIERLFNDPLLKDLKTIHLTGGSPYISPKFYATCEILSRTHPHVPVNSPCEGLYPFLLERLFRRIIKLLPQYRLGLSIDGPEEETHESVRGKGTWYPMVLTYTKLNNIGVDMRLEMTVYRENYEYIYDTYKLSKRWKIPFYLNFGRWSKRFGNEKDDVQHYDYMEKVVKRIEEQINQFGWLDERPLNADKWKVQKAMMLGQKVTWDCAYGKKAIDVDPYGFVYPCLMYPEEMAFGNFKDRMFVDEPDKVTLAYLLSGTNKAKEIMERIRNKQCQPCPFTCCLHWSNIKVE